MGTKRYCAQRNAVVRVKTCRALGSFEWCEQSTKKAIVVETESLRSQFMVLHLYLINTFGAHKKGGRRWRGTFFDHEAEEVDENVHTTTTHQANETGGRVLRSLVQPTG